MAPNWTRFPNNRPVINILRPQNGGCNFEHYILKSIFVNNLFLYLIMMTLKIVPFDRSISVTWLVQVKAWFREGEKLNDSKFPRRFMGSLDWNWQRRYIYIYIMQHMAGDFLFLIRTFQCVILHAFSLLIQRENIMHTYASYSTVLSPFSVSCSE